MKLVVLFYFLVYMYKILLYYFRLIEAHFDVALKVVYIKSCVSFRFGLDEKLGEFWGADIMFQSPHST